MVAGTALPGEQGGAHAQAGARIQGCRVGTQVGIDLRFRCGIADRIEVWLGCRICSGYQKVTF